MRTSKTQTEQPSNIDRQLDRTKQHKLEELMRLVNKTPKLRTQIKSVTKETTRQGMEED